MPPVAPVALVGLEGLAGLVGLFQEGQVDLAAQAGLELVVQELGLPE